MAAVEDERPTSSTSTFSKEEVDKLMSQGKRHFVCDEIVEAVKCFEVACFMLSTKYGALSNECADAHYQYGKSSLELARLENGVLGSALNEAVEEEVDYSDEETSKDTDGQSGTSAGASAEGSTNNKLSQSVETSAEGNGGNEAETKQQGEEQPDNKKAEGSTGVKMDEDKTASSMEDKTTDDDKDNIMEEEKTGTSEEKPVNEKVGESTGGKMVVDENKMNDNNKINDNSTDDNKDSINQEKQENKDVSEDMNMSNKESTSEEQKEEDESKETVAVNDQTKEEGQKEDAEGQKEGTEGEKEGTEGQKEGTGGQKENTEGQKEGTEGEKEGTEGQKEGTGGQKGESTTTGKQNGTDDDKDIANIKDETADDGPISTIQLAWESLELARIIFKRHNTEEMQLKLAQTHSLLGEIHMEQEQFTDAISELQKCLNIQKNLLKPDDRLLAETYYNLGLAYTLSMMYEESSNHYGNATEVLELRLKNIKARIEEAEQQDKGKSKASDDDPLVKDRKELTELEELLPEIKEKSLEAKNEGEKLKSNIKNELGLTSLFGGGSTTSTCSTSCSGETAKPANDISHLVRKQKRKTKEEEESAENSEAPAKKPRQDGDSTTTQAENGDSVMAEAADVEKLS